MKDRSLKSLIDRYAMQSKHALSKVYHKKISSIVNVRHVPCLHPRNRLSRLSSSDRYRPPPWSQRFLSITDQQLEASFSLLAFLQQRLVLPNTLVQIAIR